MASSSSTTTTTTPLTKLSLSTVRLFQDRGRHGTSYNPRDVVLSLDQRADKRDAIERCLRGSRRCRGSSATNDQNNNNNDHDSYDHSMDDASDERIDLWELRELALSPGGLLDPTLRKRAWPILTACWTMDDTTGNARGSQDTSVTPSHMDLKQLHQDVKRTVWNVQEHFQEQAKQARLIKKKRRVTFASYVDQQKLSGSRGARKNIHGKDTAEDAAPGRLTSPSSEGSHSNYSPTSLAGGGSSGADSGSDTESSVGSSTNFSFYGDQSVASTSAYSSSDEHSMWSGTTGGSSSSCRRVRWRKAGAQEQKIVANVVTSVLRTNATESDYFEDDRFHYYTGLHDLTALLMLNLESPSVTSLVLSKLADYHIRDACRKERSVLASALQLSIFPLLQSVDPVLYHHIYTTANLTLPTFCISWISSLFSTSCTDICAASRLLDVIVSSHATMPLYLTVALLTCNRTRLLQTEPVLQSVYLTLRTLLDDVRGNGGGGGSSESSDDDALTVATGTSTSTLLKTFAMAHVEDVIATALLYMKTVPPSKLLTMSEGKPDKQRLLSRVPAVAMFQEPPSWCTANESLTEYAAIQARRRASSPTKSAAPVSSLIQKQQQKPVEPKTVVQWENYPLAEAASGRSVTRVAAVLRRASAKKELVLLAALLILATLVTGFAATKAYSLKRIEPPSESSHPLNIGRLIQSRKHRQAKKPSKVTWEPKKTQRMASTTTELPKSKMFAHTERKVKVTTAPVAIPRVASASKKNVKEQILQKDSSRKTKGSQLTGAIASAVGLKQAAGVVKPTGQTMANHSAVASSRHAVSHAARHLRESGSGLVQGTKSNLKSSCRAVSTAANHLRESGSGLLQGTKSNLFSARRAVSTTAIHLRDSLFHGTKTNLTASGRAVSNIARSLRESGSKALHGTKTKLASAGHVVRQLAQQKHAARTNQLLVTQEALVHLSRVLATAARTVGTKARAIAEELVTDLDSFP